MATGWNWTAAAGWCACSRRLRRSLGMATEISRRADFTEIRYAQCWEDADVLLKALEIRPGDVCVSIASAGDNTLAMLAAGGDRVFALDLNPAQLACLVLRVAAYRALSHADLLSLIG